MAAHDPNHRIPLRVGSQVTIMTTRGGRALTDAQVIAAIRANHLKANIDRFEREPERCGRPVWERAWIDPGGTIFGVGPYLKVPIEGGEWDGCVQRVYAPARLRVRLARRWVGNQ